MIRRRGVMLVLSSPSGAGKTSISRRLLATDPELVMSVSATTRPRRPGEVEGRDYFYVDLPRFRQMIEDRELLEHACVFDHHYGTPRAPVEDALVSGRDVLFDLDWQGTRQLAEHGGRDLVRVFILPPSTAELRRRLTTRGRDPAEIVERRMAQVLEEVSHCSEYDYVIVNEDLETSIDEVRSILVGERRRRSRLTGLDDFVDRFRRGS